MPTKKFSQKNFNVDLTCDGCDARCKISYTKTYYGACFPTIAGDTIESYKMPEHGNMPIAPDTHTPQEAIDLAVKIVKYCDYYNKQH